MVLKKKKRIMRAEIIIEEVIIEIVEIIMIIIIIMINIILIIEIDIITIKKKKKKDNKKSDNDLILDYENNLRKEIELTTPLISDELPISNLTEEYKSNKEYLQSIENISKKYKTYRKVRRDGNCFYRSFIYRLFEQTCIKNDKNLYIILHQ